LRGVVEDEVATHGGERADQHRERDGDPGGEEDQRQRVLRPVAHDGRHRVARRQRHPEVAVQQAADPVQILVDKRVVEAQLLAQRGELVRRSRVREDLLRGVAGQRLGGEKHEHGDADEDQDAEPVSHQDPPREAPATPGRGRERQRLGRRTLDRGVGRHTKDSLSSRQRSRPQPVSSTVPYPVTFVEYASAVFWNDQMMLPPRSNWIFCIWWMMLQRFSLSSVRAARLKSLLNCGSLKCVVLTTFAPGPSLIEAVTRYGSPTQ